MVVKNLTLTNYRNYVNESFNYCEGINVICGKNAQGKTNSAEAIFMMCTGYSPRVKREKQVIRYGEDFAEISAEAVSSYGKVSVDIKFYSSNEKRVRVNGVAIKKIGELLGNINSVFFNPSELKLIQESPEDRRRFMDISLSQMDKKYFYALKKYNDVLSRRNSLLKSENKKLILDTVNLWDFQLIDVAAEIILARNQFISVLAPFASEAHSLIADGVEEIEVCPVRTYGEQRDEIIENLKKELNDRLQRDMVLGYTSVGPHRDDIAVTLGGKDIKAFGSQGQQRTAALALKLSELEIFKQQFDEYPLLILDDALSELDVTRQRKLLSRIEDVQTIITCTKVDNDVFNGFDYNKIEVEGGRRI